MQKKNKKSFQKSAPVSTVTAEPTTVSAVEPVRDLVELSSEDADVLRTTEQNVLKVKLRVADIELTIASLNKEKAELFDMVKNGHEEFVANARKFAVKNGINPDGEPSGDKWNLDTSTMTFRKL